MDEKFLIDHFNVKFDAKPDPVPYNYRISYKASQICLIISKTCRKRSGCSPLKLHIISFALSSNELMTELLNYVNGSASKFPIIRFDPAINRAVSFSLSDGLIDSLPSGKYTLSEKGNRLIELIDKDDSILKKEKQDLEMLSRKLTDSKIDSIEKNWRKTNA